MTAEHPDRDIDAPIGVADVEAVYHNQVRLSVRQHHRMRGVISAAIALVNDSAVFNEDTGQLDGVSAEKFNALSGAVDECVEVAS